MPSALPPERAVALWDGPWLALTCLRKADLKRGERILVYGASGSIGSSAVQLAKHMGAHVSAVCATNGLELVQSLEPDELIDYTAQDFTRLEPAFDVVLDAVGKSTFGACKPLLKTSGRYISTDRTYPLEQIVDAYRYVDAEQKLGSVVLTIATEPARVDA